MLTKTVGVFTLEVSNPAPVWIEIEVSGVFNQPEKIKFRASDLDDLEHVVRSAKKASQGEA